MSNEELVKRIKQGEKGLMSELYQNCRSFIIAIIKHIGIEQPEDFEDAMQDSYFGLYEAVKRFDESKGYKFLTYAKYHIQTAIQRGKLKCSDLPEYVYSQRRQILRKRSELMQSLGRYPTYTELALNMSMDVKTVNYILNVAKPIKSIYEDVKGVDNLTVGDTIADNRIDFENDIAAADERRYISQVVGEAINELPEEEKKISFRLGKVSGVTLYHKTTSEAVKKEDYLVKVEMEDQPEIFAVITEVIAPQTETGKVSFIIDEQKIIVRAK